MNGIHMIIQYCNDPRPQRQAEFDECLRRNLAHPVIVAIKNSPVNGTSAIGCGLRNPSRTRRAGVGWRKSAEGALAISGMLITLALRGMMRVNKWTCPSLPV